MKLLMYFSFHLIFSAFVNIQSSFFHI